MSYAEDLAAVKQNGYALFYVKEKTPELCLEAVKQEGLVLKFVKEQTPEVCLAAVKQNGYALRYAKEQTPEVCLAALEQNEGALKYIKMQTLKSCLAAMGQNGGAKACVRSQCHEGQELSNIKSGECGLISLKAPYSLRYIKKNSKIYYRGKEVGTSDLSPFGVQAVVEQLNIAYQRGYEKCSSSLMPEVMGLRHSTKKVPFKLGLDIHGVCDKSPALFSLISKIILAGGGEVHVITGREDNPQVREKLKKMGIEYTHFFSIASYHIQKRTKIWYTDPDHPWMAEGVWDRTKAEYCAENNISLHIDDSDRYGQYFTTPYYRYVDEVPSPQGQP